MLESFRQFFSKKNKVQTVSKDYLHLIPKCPPDVAGYPSVSSSDIVATQEKLLKRIKSLQEIHHDLFIGMLMPVIENFAAYVHLLPASENYHHQLKGGLFRHSLEVGLYALQSSKGHEFCANDWPKDKSANEKKWRLATFLAGMFHDIGKPYTDYYVTSPEGERWNPNASSLSTWLTNNKIEYYFIEWRTHRNKRHELRASVGIHHVMTQEMIEFLGQDIYDHLLDSITLSSLDGHIAPLIIKADRGSVENNVAKERVDPDIYSTSIASDRYIISALRRLANLLTINEEGSYIWVLEDGLYIAWHSIVKEVNNLLKIDNVKGVQKDPDALAVILLERGFAEYYRDEKGQLQNYWKISPEVENGRFHNCLKLVDVKTIFTKEPPIAIKHVLFKEKNDAVDKQEPSVEPQVMESPQNNQIPVKQKAENTMVGWEEVEKEVGAKGSSSINKMKAMAMEIDNSDSKLKTNSPPKQKTEKNKTNNTNTSKGYRYIKKAIEFDLITVLENGDVGILFPVNAKKLDTPKLVMNTLFDEKLLKSDSGFEEKINTIAGKKMLLLNQSIIDEFKLTQKIKSSAHNNQESIPQKPKYEFITHLINELDEGFGELITEEITEETKNKKKFKIFSFSTIKNIKNKYSLRENEVITALKKADFIVDKINHVIRMEVK